MFRLISSEMLLISFKFRKKYTLNELDSFDTEIDLVRSITQSAQRQYLYVESILAVELYLQGSEICAKFAVLKL